MKTATVPPLDPSLKVAYVPPQEVPLKTQLVFDESPVQLPLPGPGYGRKHDRMHHNMRREQIRGAEQKGTTMATDFVPGVSVFDAQANAKRVGVEAVGGAAGYFFGKKMFHGKHRSWLGVLAGVPAGNAAYELASGYGVKKSLEAVGAAVGTVGGAKVLKKHPVVGAVLGFLAGGYLGRFAGK